MENIRLQKLDSLKTVADKSFGGLEGIKVYHSNLGEEVWNQARQLGGECIQPPMRNGKSSVDMVLAADLIEGGIFGETEWVGVASGDYDFLPALSLIRKRAPKRKLAVISRPGVISDRVQDAYQTVVDKIVLLEEGSSTPSAPNLAEGIVKLMMEGKPPLGFWSIRLLMAWAMDPRNNLMPKDDVQVRRVITGLVDAGVFIQEREKRVSTRGGEPEEVLVLKLKEDHPFVEGLREDA